MRGGHNMLVFTLLILWMFLAVQMSKKFEHKENRKKIYCALIFIGTVFIMGFRSQYTAGVDTYRGYIPKFQLICNMTMVEVIAKYGGKDLLFQLVTKLFTYISTNPQIYLFAISAFVMGSYCYFVYKYSEMPLMSFVMYYALTYYTTCFQMLRHAVALSVLLYAYQFIKTKKLFPFLLIVMLAASFHISALFFIIAYPFSNNRIGKKQWVINAGVIFVCYFMKSDIFSLLTVFISGNERFEYYTSSDYVSQLSLTGTLILSVIYIASLLLSQRNLVNTNEYKFLFNMSALSVSFMSMVLIIGEFHRISMFFGIYNTLLLPNILKHSRINNKIVISMCIVCAMILYFLLFVLDNTGVRNYIFFWQE